MADSPTGARIVRLATRALKQRALKSLIALVSASYLFWVMFDIAAEATSGLREGLPPDHRNVDCWMIATGLLVLGWIYAFILEHNDYRAWKRQWLAAKSGR